MTDREPEIMLREAKRRLVGAVYEVAKRAYSFTAADVWRQLDDEEFRRRWADTKLIAQAFRIARRKKVCAPRDRHGAFAFRAGDATCHFRVQRVWESLVALNNLRGAA